MGLEFVMQMEHDRKNEAKDKINYNGIDLTQWLNQQLRVVWDC